MRFPLIILLTVVFLFAVSVSAQSKPDYSGEWVLNLSKTKLPETMRNVESMTIKATQSATELTVETETKRAASSNGGQGGGGRVDIGGGVTVYNLDGKEKTIEIDNPQFGKIPTKLKASFEGNGKLKLSSERTITTQGGEVSFTTKETWELADEGKTLKVHRTTITPRGETTSDMVFTKK